jgi:hypothetical protein
MSSGAAISPAPQSDEVGPRRGSNDFFAILLNPIGSSLPCRRLVIDCFFDRFLRIRCVFLKATHPSVRHIDALSAVRNCTGKDSMTDVDRTATGWLPSISANPGPYRDPASSLCAAEDLIPILSYGMGVESTAILLRWLEEPDTFEVDLGKLIVVVAMTGDE